MTETAPQRQQKRCVRRKLRGKRLATLNGVRRRFCYLQLCDSALNFVKTFSSLASQWKSPGLPRSASLARPLWPFQPRLFQKCGTWNILSFLEWRRRDAKKSFGRQLLAAVYFGIKGNSTNERGPRAKGLPDVCQKRSIIVGTLLIAIIGLKIFATSEMRSL